ncbi:GmrSD restriction endonuclease domain-containing protein [Acinetobacter sp. ANC 5502]
MKRRPSTQDITWFLDLNDRSQLELSPPYQRRSVWTTKDKKFFLDTIFRNYPSPAVFIHKSLDERGKSTYFVVDGKQRLQTILDFVDNKISIDKGYGDDRLDGKFWRDIRQDQELREIFWNYTLSVEQIDFADIEQGTIVKEIFDRLNRNSKKLTPQELRHAKYEGWFNQFAENQANTQLNTIWKDLKISTPGRERRMIDVQFISELMMILISNSVEGFDQENIEGYYADYDDINVDNLEFDENEFAIKFEKISQIILNLINVNSKVKDYASGGNNLYTLWAALTINFDSISDQNISDLATKYVEFMSNVEEAKSGTSQDDDVISYLNASKGASTDLKPREKRLEVLEKVLFNKG